MDLILVPEAERAQEIADILSTFRQHDLSKVQDITVVISALNNLSWALRELHELIDAADGRLTRAQADDLELIQQSVAFTLQDVWAILGKMPDSCTRGDYVKAWDDITLYCRDVGKQSFAIRLESYKLFLFGMCSVMRKSELVQSVAPTKLLTEDARDYPSRTQFESLRRELRTLRRLQLDDRRLITATEALSSLSVVPASKQATKQRSYERQRGPLPASPISPTTDTSDSWDPFRTAAVPTPPASPTATFSTTNSTVSSTVIETSHWAGLIFSDMSSTPLESTSDTNLCTPVSGVDSKDWPGSEYNEILRVKITSSFRIHFFFRERDLKAKMVCQWQDERSRTRYSSNSLSDLHLRRAGPCIYICRPVKGQDHVSWCRLKFTTIEWLIIFMCTFLSLRSHEAGEFSGDFLDFEQKGEDRVFAGAIRDNGYRHALRVYRDRRTRAVRIQASALTGPMNKTPIWTAFITHAMQSRTWYRRSKNVVYLSELKRFIFSADYKPHIAANGEHILHFDLTKDAEDFVKTIDDLASSERHRR